jgi:hypothetical protein
MPTKKKEVRQTGVRAKTGHTQIKLRFERNQVGRNRGNRQRLCRIIQERNL